jgi:hypothetical protein
VPGAAKQTGFGMKDSTADLAALYLAERRRLQRRIGRMVGCRATAAYLARSARNTAIDHRFQQG